MASSIAQIMQSMRPEYIILSCQMKGGEKKKSKEREWVVKSDRKGRRERSVNEGKGKTSEGGG